MTHQRPSRLARNTDYLYCTVCQVHVPCLRLPSGGWEVQCPGCAGECGMCHCHLQRFCFGSREQFPPVHADATLVGRFDNGPGDPSTRGGD